MATQDDGAQPEQTTSGGKLSAAARQAQQAIDSAKDLAAGVDVDQLRSRAADAASALYQGGRDLLPNSDQLSKATDQFSNSIRKNPLAAVGIAFTAGLLLALLTRG
ncbi:MAG: hypothetical protein WAK41_18255 [Roseiarcus sp.]|jgi:ElaB/YqjD/DUF883 family membrane-anchored ribosome-binding protein|uniref:hypothetical protein n=1 Tax=Roseiarcus sp. TaxID=1969460 RepID=UPI003BB05795